MEAWKEELYHHGIRGQKWGKRNGPPYPLKPSDHSAAEKKAGYQKSIKGNNASAGGFAEDVALELGSYALALVAVVAISRISSNIRQKKEVENNKKESNDAGEIHKIKGKHSEAEDMESINPGYRETSDLKYRMNCTMCTASYELRRRGYDVEANKSVVGRDNKQVESWYKNGKFTKCDNYDHLAMELKSQPEGARGDMHVAVGDFGSLHSMVWEKKNGKVIIRDCQTNDTYDLYNKLINTKVKNPYVNSYMRTDNLEIDWENIRDAVIPKKRY